MSPARMLLDTCAYLRLARSIRPLLGVKFGEERYCLYVIEDFQAEFDKQTRLQTKFSWINQPEYVENRLKCLQVSHKERKQAKLAYDVILAFADSAKLGISLVDARAVALAYMVKIPLITDDTDVQKACKEFGVRVFKTLELLKLMVDCQHITMGKIREIAGYWQYEKDLPKDFLKDYRKLFHESPPKY